MLPEEGPIVIDTICGPLMTSEEQDLAIRQVLRNGINGHTFLSARGTRAGLSGCISYLHGLFGSLPCQCRNLCVPPANWRRRLID